MERPLRGLSLHGEPADRDRDLGSTLPSPPAQRRQATLYRQAVPTVAAPVGGDTASGRRPVLLGRLAARRLWPAGAFGGHYDAPPAARS